jgi:NADH dehydrogenase
MKRAMKIVITGVKGFLGRHLSRAALDGGHTVLGLDQTERLNRAPLWDDSGYEEAVLDLPDLSSILAERLEESQAVIHGAGLIEGSKEALFRINVDGTRALLRAGNVRFVYISSQAVTETSQSLYGRSKGAAEKRVIAEADDHVILRPAMMYGRGDGGWTARLEHKVKRKRILLLPGGGQTKIQPLYVEDAAQAILAAAEREGAGQGVFDLGGPEPIALAAFLRLARSVLAGGTLFVSLPRWPFLLIRTFMASAAYWTSDHGVDIGPARRALGFRPRSYEEGLRATFTEKESPQ